MPLVVTGLTLRNHKNPRRCQLQPSLEFALEPSTDKSLGSLGGLHYWSSCCISYPLQVITKHSASHRQISGLTIQVTMILSMQCQMVPLGNSDDIDCLWFVPWGPIGWHSQAGGGWAGWYWWTNCPLQLSPSQLVRFNPLVNPLVR